MEDGMEKENNIIMAFQIFMTNILIGMKMKMIIIAINYYLKVNI